MRAAMARAMTAPIVAHAMMTLREGPDVLGGSVAVELFVVAVEDIYTEDD